MTVCTKFSIKCANNVYYHCLSNEISFSYVLYTFVQTVLILEVWRHGPREYWMIEWLRARPFRSRMIWLLALPPLPSTVAKVGRRHTGRLRKRDNMLTGEREMGWARSQIIRPQETLALYKAFNTLCLGPSTPTSRFMLDISALFKKCLDIISFCKAFKHVRKNIFRIFFIQYCYWRILVTTIVKKNSKTATARILDWMWCTIKTVRQVWKDRQ